MGLVSCTECRAQISDKSAHCIKCGAPRIPAQSAFNTPNEPPPQEETTRRWPWFVGIPVLGVIAFAFYAGNSPEGQAKARERRTIELCWQDQQRKSLDPGTQRFVAGVCEKLESEFREKHRSAP